MLLRRELHARGLRYRLHVRVDPTLRSRPDVVFRRWRLAVYVDGCFWHRCPEPGTLPANNGEWWRLKLDANVARDRTTDEALMAAGWTVIRVWEHEDPVAAADRIETALVRLGRSGGQRHHRPDADARE
jgi:DNA mismatch endonuclease (patch repair protein)